MISELTVNGGKTSGNTEADLRSSTRSMLLDLLTDRFLYHRFLYSISENIK